MTSIFTYSPIILAAEDVPPCPDCGSLNVVVYTKNPDGQDRAWCTMCEKVWAVEMNENE